MDVGLVGLIFVVLEKKTLAVSSTKRGGRGGGLEGGVGLVLPRMCAEFMT